MSLDDFLRQLHVETEEARPADWEVNWADAPLPFKLYRGLPTVTLCSEVPLTLEGQKAPVKPDTRSVGHFLWYVFGLTQWCQAIPALDSEEQKEAFFQLRRRFVPSGGACYPSELYLYLKLEDLPAGIYHYDVAHHRLVQLREGLFDSYLDRALGHRCPISDCFGVALVSTFYWKNFFKYSNFAYRLQGLDAGVLIGHLLKVAEQVGFSSAILFQYLDRAVSHLLGINEQEESAYALLPLSLEPINLSLDNDGGEVRMETAMELCRELPLLCHDHYMRSRHIKDYSMLTRMNEVSRQESWPSFRLMKPGEGEQRQGITASQMSGEAFTLKESNEWNNGGNHELNIEGNGQGEIIALPAVKRLSYDLASACCHRSSPDLDFVLSRINQVQLAALLQEATAAFGFQSDLERGQGRPSPRLSLYGCLYGIEGIPNGAYQYDEAAHSLKLIRPGDHRLWLQHGMSLHNVNLCQVPLCLHVVGDKNHLRTVWGYRGYRIQQMEAGMLVQHLLLAASAIGWGGHPLLGYDVNLADEIYGLAPQGETCLIQVPIGPYRPRLRLTGGLHS
ncbi:SagB family peptide dehydrogenase [Paenibacillus sp. J2TS4]|uniref:SagB family peptide dehydrogenase n=1 Tax=Paenibacillus sp. J2TS4 TaxID=2807194 RepID=UPI001B058570|nr:SagB family peptide dehydrogenase [Paenibacillus sp. J2TS4]GIP33189.1 NADH oxidase [Paenibacillus sp. J2TS4]